MARGTLLLGCVATVACNADAELGADNVCGRTPSVLDDLAAVAITGRSAADVLAEVEGTYTGSIAWSDDALAVRVGAPTTTPITLEIAYAGGELRSIDAELVQSCPHLGPCPCEDRLEIDVMWRLSTADGALDETWAAPVVHEPTSFHMPQPQSIGTTFQLAETAGSLDFTSFDLHVGHEIVEMIAAADLASGAAIGIIGVELTSADGSLGAGSVASFAGVRAVDGAACAVIEDASLCAAAGCTSATGRRLHGFTPDCECAAPEPFCVAVGPSDVPMQLYTRKVGEAGSEDDEVVLLPALDESGPSPWRACAEAPEVEACECIVDDALCQ